jgi:c(7)-type cytochrome triheme protein
MHKTILLAAFFLLLTVGICFEAQGLNLPPSQYGNILISRMSDKQGQPWVTFSHWSHRVRYTCRTCHFELEFEMKVNATDITEDRNRKGEFCGSCHDGKTAFGHTKGNCSRCHNGNIAYGEERFKELASLPMARYGNRIDWSKAVREGNIKPRQSLFNDNYSPIPFITKIQLEAKGANIEPAVFPHKSHTQWLDCANCHPATFNIKKTTTKDLSMKHICEGSFCGTCHGSVAFPLNDCNRCHPGVKQ